MKKTLNYTLTNKMIDIYRKIGLINQINELKKLDPKQAKMIFLAIMDNNEQYNLKTLKDNLRPFNYLLIELKKENKKNMNMRDVQIYKFLTENGDFLPPAYTKQQFRNLQLENLGIS